jgi:predicted nucleic acid-binding protein
VAGLTLDSGALIAFERSERRMIAHLKEAQNRGVGVTVSAAVVAEIWRGGLRGARIAMLLRTCVIEPVSESLARSAGEALAAVGSTDTIDAIVMASAAMRGDRVLTSDPDDLLRLQAHFPVVRVLSL